jgi:hypothetical protein
VIDVEKDVGVDIGMTVVRDGVLGEGRVGLRRDLPRDLPEDERQGGQGQPRPDKLFPFFSFVFIP